MVAGKNCSISSYRRASTTVRYIPPMHTTISPIALVLAALTFSSSAAGQPDLSALYHQCTQAYVKVPQSVTEVLSKCEQAASAGVPAAQYVLGALLVNRGTPAEVARGAEWLEKAVASGSIPAAYHLAPVLVQKSDETSQSRGRDLFKRAVCLGYPPALEALAEHGGSEAMQCTPPPNTDFGGEWVVAVKWDKASNTAPEDSYKLSVDRTHARVFVRSGKDWVEVKRGKFAVQQHEQSLRVSATDEGWDFDGKWIETWTFDLLRTGPNESFVTYLRTVNNPYMPAHLSWQTFSDFAEGTARRTP